jgi:hypothetical protein
MLESTKHAALSAVADVLAQTEEIPTPMDKLDPVQLSLLGGVLLHMEDIQDPATKFARSEWFRRENTTDVELRWMLEYSWYRENKRCDVSLHNIPCEYLAYQWLHGSWWDDLQAVILSLQWLGFHVYDYKFPDKDLTQFVDLVVSWEALPGFPLNYNQADEEPIEHIYYPPGTLYRANVDAARDQQALATVLGKRRGNKEIRFNSPTSPGDIKALVDVLQYVDTLQQSPEDFDHDDKRCLISSISAVQLLHYLNQRCVPVYLKMGEVWLHENGNDNAEEENIRLLAANKKQRL